MQPNHYTEVPRHVNDEPGSLTEVVETHTKMVPLDLEGQHERANRLNYLTLRAKFLVPIIFILGFFPFSIIMLILSVGRSGGDATQAIGVLANLEYISESNPVVDIMPITGSQVCNDNTFTPGNLGTWGATNEGCYCSASTRLMERACSTEELSKGCVDVPRTYREDTFTWNGDRFCMRRLNNFIRTAGACPSGYSKCGNLFCTPSTEFCPITDVQILAKTDPTPTGYIARPLTFDKKLVLERAMNSDKQFVQFNYNMQTPCLDENSYAKRINNLTYHLEKFSYIGCQEYGADVESKAVDTITEEDFYKYNYVSDQTSGLPLFATTLTGSTVTLSARFRFVTKRDDTCAQYYFSDTYLFIRSVEEFSDLYRGITIAGMILSTITFIIALVYLRVIKREGLWIVNREEPFGRRFIVQIICLITLFAVTTCILGRHYLSEISEQESYIKSIQGKDCFITQPRLNDALDVVVKYLKNKIDILSPLNILLAIVSGGVAAFVFINMFFRKLRGYEKGNIS